MARDLSADSSGQVDRSRRTEEGDGAAELTAPVTSDLDVELVQPLHDVAVAHLPVAHVAGETGAPAGQRRRGWSLAPVVLVGKTEQVEEVGPHPPDPAWSSTAAVGVPVAGSGRACILQAAAAVLQAAVTRKTLTVELQAESWVTMLAALPPAGCTASCWLYCLLLAALPSPSLTLPGPSYMQRADLGEQPA